MFRRQISGGASGASVLTEHELVYNHRVVGTRRSQHEGVRLGEVVVEGSHDGPPRPLQLAEEGFHVWNECIAECNVL